MIFVNIFVLCEADIILTASFQLNTLKKDMEWSGVHHVKWLSMCAIGNWLCNHLQKISFDSNILDHDESPLRLCNVYLLYYNISPLQMRAMPKGHFMEDLLCLFVQSFSDNKQLIKYIWKNKVLSLKLQFTWFRSG